MATTTSTPAGVVTDATAADTRDLALRMMALDAKSVEGLPDAEGFEHARIVTELERRGEAFHHATMGWCLTRRWS